MESLHTAEDSDETRNESNASSASVTAGREEPIAPPEVVREVAASLTSLAKVLTYAEYEAIVHRIARLRWRCGAGLTTKNSYDMRS